MALLSLKHSLTWQKWKTIGFWESVSMWLSSVSHALDLDKGRWGIWPPVIMAMGIGWYFNSPSEPVVTVATMGLIGLWLGGALALIVRHNHVITRAAGWIMVWGIIGWGAAWWRTSSLTTPMLDRPLGVVHIQGTVTTVAHPASSRRLFQRVVVRLHHDANPCKGSIIDTQSEPRSPHAQEAPHRASLPKGSCVQITIRTPCQPLLEGDVISFRANVIPIGESLTGYPARRSSFFQGIGATGFAVSSPRIHQRLPSRWSVWRHSITRQLMALMPAPVGSVACGLVTGDTLAIPSDVRNAFSVTGLSHLLSISGLHLSLVSGVCFVTCRWLIGRLSTAALWINVDTVASCTSVAFSWMYMMISGQRYPVQRAFWMLAATFGAMLVARRRQSLRTLAQCATVFLVCHPEALCNVGFQLSFTAVATILSWSAYDRGRYDTKRRHMAVRGQKGGSESALARQLRQWFKPIRRSIISSGVVTLATWPLMMHHFGQVSWQGLFTNIVAIPVMSFVIAPLGMLAVSTLSLSWGNWILGLWSWALTGCVYCVQWLATWGDIMVRAGRPLSSSGCAVMMLGIFWTLIWQRSWRWWGLMVTFGVLAFESTTVLTPPTLIIDANHKCAVFCDPQHPILWVTSTKRGKNHHHQWSTQWGKRTIQPWPHTTEQCHAIGLPAWTIEEHPDTSTWRLQIHDLPSGTLFHPSLAGVYTLCAGMGVMALDAFGAMWGGAHQRPWSQHRPLFPLAKNDMLRTPPCQPKIHSS